MMVFTPQLSMSQSPIGDLCRICFSYSVLFCSSILYGIICNVPLIQLYIFDLCFIPTCSFVNLFIFFNEFNLISVLTYVHNTCFFLFFLFIARLHICIVPISYLYLCCLCLSGCVVVSTQESLKLESGNLLVVKYTIGGVFYQFLCWYHDFYIEQAARKQIFPRLFVRLSD